jgi:hypothetical protein
VFLIGLTGGIASGKSTVAERFVKHGAELIDADEIARGVTQPGTRTYHEIVEHFGHEILDGDGFIDRAALGAVVFDDDRQRAVLTRATWHRWNLAAETRARSRPHQHQTKAGRTRAAATSTAVQGSAPIERPRAEQGGAYRRRLRKAEAQLPSPV